MERNKKIQLGLLAVVAILLAANLLGGGFKSWFGQSEGDKIRESAATLSNNKVRPADIVTMDNSRKTIQKVDANGNIVGTNVNTPALPQGPTTMIRYEADRFDFGVVDEGEVVKHIFKFTNVGKEPLLISNCKGSCGCTVPTWPKEPIPPGGNGEIKVEFNTKGKPGQQSKRVTVTANTVPTETFLEIKGEVRGKQQPDARGGK